MVSWSFPSETTSTWLGLKGTVDSSLKDAQKFYFWLICSLREDINQQNPGLRKSLSLKTATKFLMMLLSPVICSF